MTTANCSCRAPSFTESACPTPHMGTGVHVGSHEDCLASDAFAVEPPPPKASPMLWMEWNTRHKLRYLSFRVSIFLIYL